MTDEQEKPSASDLLAKEGRRVARILKRDAADREADERRRVAEATVAGGGWANPEDLVVPATPEWKAQGEYVEIGARRDGDSYQQRQLRTVRRVTGMRIIKLYTAGVLCEDRLAACRFYRDLFDRSGLVGSYAASQLGKSGSRGEVAFGSMARTEREAEARQLFRLCRTFIDERHLKGFDYVVLDDLGMREAAQLFKVRDRAMKQIVRLGSLRMYQELAARDILGSDKKKTPSIDRA